MLGVFLYLSSAASSKITERVVALAVTCGFAPFAYDSAVHLIFQNPTRSVVFVYFDYSI